MLKLRRYYILTAFLVTLYSVTYSQHNYGEMSFLELVKTITYTSDHFNSIGRASCIKNLEEIILVSENFDIKNKNHLKAHAYNSIGKIHYALKDYKKAIKSYTIAESYAKKLDGVPKILLKINNNIALVNLNGFNRPEIALEKIKHIYENSDGLNETSLHILGLNLASIHIKIGEYDKAFPLLESGKEYFVNCQPIPIRLISTYTTYGQYHHHKKEYQKAIEYYELAATIAERNQLFRKAMDVYELYEHLLVETKNSDKAYSIVKRYSKLHRAVLKKEQLETDQFKEQLIITEHKKTIETQKAKQSKTISLFTLGLLSLSLLLFCFFIYHHKKTKTLGKSLAVKNKELKIAKEKSDHLAAVKTKFISTVSHELRTPLYGVVGLSSILMERIKDEENHKFIKLMKFSANHLLNLINDVLQVTKMESYEISLDKSSYNIKNLSDDIKNSFEYQADKNGNTLHLYFDSNIPTRLIGDSVRLSQILINLISNANKFTKNGNIYLNFINPIINDSTVELTFEVKDDGRGIPLDKQETIFDKFSQANSKDYATGTGLGLHIVKSLVNLHGGDIILKSIPGQGSTFSFTITLDIDTKYTEDNKTNNAKEYSSLINAKDYNILVVEDNKINQIVTQNVLRSRGYNSEIANDGLIAIKMIKEKDYDLILMDLHMPNMGGIESTKIIREFNLYTPIIALTASDTQNTVNTILNSDSGFNDFLRKPYKNEEFFQKIKSNINNAISKNI
ncbi:ATP-binding protein [Aquimarina sp. 2201CG5-10]|uniref:ATP-binding protein n=1 Tax=Aquimarina callyspongiae TaxID=3098150 RepID=UPI002AB57501|nr:ATP-binding protein [Aquimarina sp. 2201CG5-10]MDY8138959.1 ATP-binding protein [Aquimarina sp. 2201CG5-10]